MSDSPPSCPFCASTHTVERHRFLSPPDVATRFRVMRCARCDHQFTTPLPESALLERIYASQAHTEFQTRNDHLEGRRAVDDSRWAWLARRATPGVVVDVGCGSGLFLSRTPSDEWQPVGVEPEKTLADFAREHHGITMAANLDEALQDREPPSLITLWDVLEHMLDPRGEVERFRDALAPGGMLAIGAPNVRSLCARAFGAHWWGWSVPAHLHHFSSDTLRALLTDAGLEVVEIRFANYGFYLAASWDLMMGADMSQAGTFAGEPSWRVRALRRLARRMPRAAAWLRRQTLHRIDTRIDPERGAGQRDYVVALARKPE